jgi:hypothetical protein
MIADRICGQLRRSADGSYQAHPSHEILLPAASPLLIASLLAPDGNIVQNQTLQLWDESEDVSAFACNTSEYYDPWKSSMWSTKSYYLVLASDLEIHPQPAHWYILNSHTRLYLLDKNWPTDTQILLEGSVLWQPKIAFATTVQHESVNTNEIEIHLYDTPLPLAFQRPIRFEISHPSDYMIAFIRSAGQSIPFDRHTSRLTVTSSITLQPHMLSLKAAPSLELTLGIQRIGTPFITRQRYTLEIPMIGAALLSQEGWTAIKPAQQLNIEQARRQPVRFYLPGSEPWSLLEGDAWIGETWKTPKTLHACAGFGAPLKIQQSAYNASALEPPHPIVREVINTGCVKTATIAVDDQNLQSHRLQLQLTRPIEPDEHHQIVWWDQDGSYTFLRPESEDIQDDIIWSATLPASCTQPLAIAVAYDGYWLGTWYRNNWSKILTPAPIYATTFSSLMRWFHLPLLSQENFADIEWFSWTHATDTLSIWLDDTCPLPDLQFTSCDDNWLSVVRKIFFNWQVENNIDALIQHIADRSSLTYPPEIALQMVWKLSRVSPVLMAKILRAWIEKVCIPQGGMQQSIILVSQLCYEVAEVNSEDALSKRKAQLLHDATTEMHVDTHFINKALLARATLSVQGQHLSPIDRDNIAVAMQVEPFRRLLSIHLLNHIYQQLVGNRSKK